MHALLPLAAALLLAASPQGNPYLAASKRLYHSLDFEKAQEQLDRARSVPDTTPEELVEIEQYTGLVKYELGDVEGARAAFRTALALNPRAELTMEVSPKIAAEWNDLRRRMERLEKAQPAAPPRAAEVKPAEPRPAEPKPAEPKVAEARPPELKPAEPQPAPAGELSTPTPQPSAVSAVGPFALMGTGAALAGAGGILGYLSSQQSKQAQAADVQVDVGAHDSTARNQAVAANALYAAAGVAVTGGVIWLLMR